MGCVSGNERQLRVATLNYSGILKNPFEFYTREGKEQQEKLSDLFALLMENNSKTSGEDFKWNMGPIDQRMQVERYTPIYRKGAGV